MLAMRASMGAAVQRHLFTHDEARNSTPGEPLAQVADWLATYPVNGHADLGRAGSVCPFVKQASRLDTIRIAINPAGPDEEEAVFTEIRDSFAVLNRIPAPPGKKRLGTIAYGFPNCDSPEGLAMLERVYSRHKYYTLFRFRMIAFFHAENDIHGLWNPDFRPMRSPFRCWASAIWSSRTPPSPPSTRS